MEITRSDFRQNSVTFTLAKTQQSLRMRCTRLGAVWTVVLAVVSVWERSATSLVALLVGVFLSSQKTRAISESVMAVRGVGVQLTARFSDGSERHTLIPHQDIEDVVINEAPAGFIIRTYLVVVGKGGKKFLPFEHSDLKIKTSAEVLFILRAVLFNEQCSSDISSCCLLGFHG